LLSLAGRMLRARRNYVTIALCAIHLRASF
jgi:hypothetical protein